MAHDYGARASQELTSRSIPATSLGSSKEVEATTNQNAMRAPSCNVLGSRAPVALPKVPGLDRLVLQPDRLTRLKKLKNSKRNCIWAPSGLNHGTFVFLMALTSNCARPGPR